MGYHTTASWSVAVVAKYLGPTNTKGGRINVRRGDHKPGDPTLTVSWDHALSLENNYVAAIQQYLEEREWEGTWVIGSTNDGFVGVRLPRDLAPKEADAPT